MKNTKTKIELMVWNEKKLKYVKLKTVKSHYPVLNQEDLSGLRVIKIHSYRRIKTIVVYADLLP